MDSWKGRERRRLIERQNINRQKRIEQARIESYFWWLRKDMSLNELQHLLRCGSKVFQVPLYMFDENAREAIAPPHKLISWPVQYVLGLHPKYIVKSKRQVDPQKFGCSLKQFEHKVCWVISFADMEQGEWSHLASKKPVATCNAPLGDVIDPILDPSSLISTRKSSRLLLIQRQKVSSL